MDLAILMIPVMIAALGLIVALTGSHLERIAKALEKRNVMEMRWWEKDGGQ